MKKIISLIMIVILTIFMVGCSNKKQTFYKNQLNIVSDSKGEYVIVLSDDTKEIDTYSMYKLISYQEYEKLYDFPVSSNQAIIFHRILWNDDKFYLFEDGVKLYDAETGNEISKSSINTTPADDEKCYNRINKGTFFFCSSNVSPSEDFLCTSLYPSTNSSISGFLFKSSKRISG